MRTKSVRIFSLFFYPILKISICELLEDTHAKTVAGSQMEALKETIDKMGCPDVLK
jgi:hypothetical protein